MRYILRFSPLWVSLSILATLFLGYQSLVSTGSPPAVGHFDKLMHFVAYGVLAGLWRLALPRTSLSVIVVVLIAYGTGLELAQHFMAQGRTGSAYDAVANALGALVGGYSASGILALFSQTSKSKPRLETESVRINTP